jgi:hypothetical protein
MLAALTLEDYRLEPDVDRRPPLSSKVMLVVPCMSTVDEDREAPLRSSPASWFDGSSAPRAPLSLLTVAAGITTCGAGRLLTDWAAAKEMPPSTGMDKATSTRLIGRRDILRYS